MRVGLAWLDPADPTDRAVERGLGGALRARGHSVTAAGPGRAPARADAWHLNLFGRDPRPFIARAERRRWRVVTTLHLVLEDYLRFAGGLGTLRRLARLGPLTLVCRAQKREFARLAPSLARGALVVYPYGPSLPEVPAAPARTVPSVLCAARLAPYKGVDVLLMAFARLADSGIEARLRLAGRDKSNGALAAFARRLGLADRVDFLGELSPRALAREVSAAAAFALPSRRDNLPIALLEAMSRGKAVVSTRTGGIPELVEDGRSGLLVPPGDAERMAGALRSLLTRPGLARRLGRAAEARARLFSWDAAAAAFEPLYHA
ncbi:MAG: glycosyltransferase family 4 protein [Elusimicrobia bacterium]|nr:glycosyltransferase family 4 protein [Elusimicrobiota bacterium]